jgi:lipocalin
MKLHLTLIGTVLITTAASSSLRGGRGLSLIDLGDLCYSWMPSWVCSPDSNCPAVSPVVDFDVDKYIENSWFVQKQQVNGYQQPEDLYCVTATYNKREDGLIKVENRANKKTVNGELVGGGGGGFSQLSDLCAKQVDEGTGKLIVQPCLLFNIGLQKLTGGPYWVLAVDKDNYEWAIISGGQPTDVVGGGQSATKTDVRCTTKTTGTNGSGLWLFTREPIPADGVVEAMEKKLLEMGVSTSKLLDVPQKGCNYHNVPLKLKNKSPLNANAYSPKVVEDGSEKAATKS